MCFFCCSATRHLAMPCFLAISPGFGRGVCLCISTPPPLISPRIKCEACRRRSRRVGRHHRAHTVSDRGSPARRRRSERLPQPFRRDSASASECGSRHSSCTSLHTPGRSSQGEAGTPHATPPGRYRSFARRGAASPWTGATTPAAAAVVAPH